MPEIKNWFAAKFNSQKFNSAEFWENRYKSGDNSGNGSYGELAQFKADTINQFVKQHQIQSVIDFGCGDGNQLSLAEYPDYIGFDVSETIITKCKSMFSADNGKTFRLLSEYNNETADLTLSLDVIYHLIENKIYEQYMHRLFSASQKFVIIYSSNFDQTYVSGAHVKHRKFTKWVNQHLSDWQLLQKIPQKYPQQSSAEFFVYEKK